MNKIVKGVKTEQKIETSELFNAVNDFCLTRLRLRNDHVYASKRV